jgi:hypothetical protein
LVAGVALTLTAIKQPDGIAAAPPPPLVKLWHMISSRWDGRNGNSAGAANPAPAGTPPTPVGPAVES